MIFTAPRRRFLLAASVFVFLLLRPAYMAQLRRELQARLPDYWSQLDTNGGFSVLLPELTGSRLHDEALYAARVHQILIHGFPFNPYLREDRALGAWIHQSLSMYLLAVPALFCGGNLTLAWSVTVALLGALWFLFFTAIFKWWSGKEEVAVPLALFSVFFPDLYFWLLDINFHPGVLWDRYAAVFFQDHCVVRPGFYRLPSGFLAYFLLGLLLLGAWKLIADLKSRPLKALLLGLGFGMMTLVHAYSHVFGMATLTALTAALWALKFPAPARKNSLLALGSGVLVSAGYLLMMSRLVDPQARNDSLEWAGLVHSHRFFLITLIHLIFAGFGAWRYQETSDPKRRSAWLVLIAAQIAAFLCRNLQVVIGVMIQPFHYIPLGSIPGCLMLFLWLSEGLAQKSWWDRRLSGAVCLFLLVWAGANEKSAAERTYQMCGLPQDIEGGLQWVGQHAAKDALVLSLSVEVNKAVPLYTAAKVQVAPPDANISAPFTKEGYFLRVAQLLKTLRVDPEKFLAERWLLSGPKNELLGRMNKEQLYLGRYDGRDFESAEWFYPQYAWDSSDAPILAGRQRITELTRQAQPIVGPYYLWLNFKDAHLLSQSPKSLGGKLVYENPSVKIYSF